MPRQSRIEYENAWYLVTHRAQNKKFIFQKNIHKQYFLELLSTITKKYWIEIHTYCLMTNHYHLLIRTPKLNLSQAMCYLNSKFAQRFNFIEERDGSVFNGRFDAQLITTDEYL